MLVDKIRFSAIIERDLIDLECNGIYCIGFISSILTILAPNPGASEEIEGIITIREDIDEEYLIYLDPPFWIDKIIYKDQDK